MTPAPDIDATGPEPPAECLGFVIRGAPALQGVERSIARFGYSHSEPGALSDVEIAAAGLVVVRGLVIDTLHRDTPDGRAALRGDENLELLRRLPREQRK
jgi:hypothetical protein